MYAKVFHQILRSTIARNFETRHIFEDLLKLCDKNGVVDIPHDVIAREINVPEAIVRKAIAELEAPDELSRTPDHGGRRIVRLEEHRDWGWFIVNYQYYRNLVNEEQRREKTRLRVQKFRGKNGDSIPEQMAAVAAQEPPKRESLKRPSLEEIKLHAAKIGLPPAEAEKFFSHYESNGWKVGKNPMKNWHMAMSGWKLRNEEKRQTAQQPKPIVTTHGNY